VHNFGKYSLRFDLVKVSRSLFQKIESLLHTAGFKVRYEKGTFKGGACLIQDEKVVVINKFYSLDGQINTLLDILKSLDTDESSFSPEQMTLFRKLKTSTPES